jgi:Fe2+ transport system protein FeoA
MMHERPESETLLLSEARIGVPYRVVRISAQGVIRQRMLDMGLVPGVRLMVVRFAPLGDPIEIRINRFFMSLRKEEAGHIHIEPAGHCHAHHRGHGRFGRFFYGR